MAACQAHAVYAGEKEGNVKCVLDTFATQTRYMEAYCSSIPTFSAEDSYESLHWGIHAEWAGEQMAGWEELVSRLGGA